MSSVDPRSRAWSALTEHAARLAPVASTRLLDEPGRLQRLSLRLGPLRVDLARQRIDLAALAALHELARACDHGAAVAALLRGDAVNATEQRPALHTALRAPLPSSGDGTPAADAARAAHATLARMATLVAACEAEYAAGHVTDVIHIGIGGSDLGPRLVCEALGPTPGRPRVHFLANVDGTAFERAIAGLDPTRTRVLLASKSFSTQESLLNAEAVLDWMRRGGISREFALAQRFHALTAKPEAARAWGLADAQVLPLWDWVGGRYSLWSAVGLPIAIALGLPVFRRLLAGAHAMDQHYATAPADDNLPLLLALAEVWNRNALGLPTRAMLVYDERLRLLPGFLQQLEMESNGKGVDREGRPLARPAAPVTWGELGTNAQHAFMQALHQGVDVVPCEFVAAIRPAHGLAAHHAALLANLLAQSAALMRGSAEGEPWRRSPGGRPSSIVLLDALDPESLGMLLALYEHRTHAAGVLWGVDSYDQWGVELGKRIARDLLPALEGRAASVEIDAATAASIAEIRARS